MRFAFELSLMGIGMVFFVLILLTLSIHYLGRLASTPKENKKEREEEVATKEIEREDSDTIPDEIVAVIAAALAMEMGKEEKSIRILSMKSIPDKSWRFSYRSPINQD